MKNEKYIINIDFRTKSRVHLNSVFYKVDTRCIRREKKKEFGGWVTYSKEDAEKFLQKSKKLFFDNKPVTNLRTCHLCSKLDEYDFPEFIDEDKFISEKIQISLYDYDIPHQKIEKCLDDIITDVHKIVKNLHFFLGEKDKELKESFTNNLWVFDNSIYKGKQLITQKRFQQGLIDHGFHSPEIERKMELYNQSRDYEFHQQELDEIEPQKGANWYSRLFRCVGRNLGMINVILGSLASIISAFGAAEEFKQSLENTITYS